MSLLDRLRANLAQSAGDRPAYRRISEFLEGEISRGVLMPGGRLPPQREVARALGVNTATVTRAYRELRLRGYVGGRTGQGTRVLGADLGMSAPAGANAPADPALIDLTINRPATGAAADATEQAMRRLPRDPRFQSLADYLPAEGPLWAREAALTWIAHSGFNAAPETVVLTAGAQHALFCCLAGLIEPGDVVLADPATYQGIGALGRLLGFRVEAVACDDSGMRPDALAAAARSSPARAVFLVPSIQNPTTLTLGTRRRRELADVAKAHDLWILEDDVYGRLLDARPSAIACAAPERTCYITGTSKAVAPGLRIGVAAVPGTLRESVVAALRTNQWMVSAWPLLAFARWTEDGELDRIVRANQEELTHRNRLAAEILPPTGLHQTATGTHIWMDLPEPWRAAAFERAARDRGVAVLPGEAFATGRAPARQGVRVNLGAARSRDQLRQALTRLRAVLEAGPPAGYTYV